MNDPSLDRDPFEGVAESFLARYRAGERPSIAEYAARHPELADQIRRLLPALVMVEQDLSVGRRPRHRTAGIRSRAGRGGWATTGSSGRSAGAGWGWCTRPNRSAWAAAWH